MRARFPPASSGTTRRIGACCVTTRCSPTSCSIISATRRAPMAIATILPGSRLTIVLTSEPLAIMREYDELWKKALDGIGLRFETRKGPFSDNIKAAEACQLAMWGSSWGADYPDGENFMQLFYGPNIAPEQSCVLRIRGVRRDVRADEGDAGFTGARSAVRQVEPPAGSRRRAEDGRIALPQRAGLSAGPGLPLSPDAERGVGVSGYRPCCRTQTMMSALALAPAIRTASPRFRARTMLRWSWRLRRINIWPPNVDAADMNKVVRHVFPAAEEGFDPQAAHDLYSGSIEQAIFETLLTYDYLARPSKLVPLTAEALPEITDGGKTYTIRLKKGIHFAADPAFKGRRANSSPRTMPIRSSGCWIPRCIRPGRGCSKARSLASTRRPPRPRRPASSITTPRSPGLEVVDRYTLRIRLKQPDYNLSYVLAHEPTSAVAREVVEMYADAGGRVMANPVGTGPYKLVKWIRSSKIFLEANPDFRGFVWDFQAGHRPGRRAHRRRDEGQEDAAGRARRGQHHGRGPVAPARVPERRTRPHEPRGTACAQGAQWRRPHAEMQKQGRQAVALRRSRNSCITTGT